MFLVKKNALPSGTFATGTNWDHVGAKAKKSLQTFFGFYSDTFFDGEREVFVFAECTHTHRRALKIPRLLLHFISTAASVCVFSCLLEGFLPKTCEGKRQKCTVRRQCY